MHLRLALAGSFLALSIACETGFGQTNDQITINRLDYTAKVRGFWLGACIANWTGLATENLRTDSPFLTDEDWQTTPAGRNRPLDYILDQDPWLADDDTDIEYVYQHALEQYETHLLTGEQISTEWQEHIGLPLLWVSNLSALGQMQNGAVPPATSLPENNPMWDMIDAQLTTEIFGVLAPSRPDVALQIAHLPIRTTAYLHSEWAAEFYVIMHALAPVVEPTLSRKDQLVWLADQARARVPDWSYIADMYDFVRAEYLANPDKDNWEETRDKIHERYQNNVTAGYQYRYPWDAGINFAASIVSLLYGEGDYQKTIRIGTLAGWDSDNPTATWGGLLGFMYGYDELAMHFDNRDFADGYNIERTRLNLPYPTDSITAMSNRALEVIDRIVVDAMGGAVDGDNWIIPTGTPVEPANTLETLVPWTTIEDSDPRWTYRGFASRPNQWNASGATLAFGAADCSAEVTFRGTAVQYYAFRGPTGGTVTVSLDGTEHGPIDLKFDGSPHGQHYVKVFEATDLQNTDHTLRIDCDSSESEKTIDMLSIIGG
jgi:hypothetical protein